MAEQYKGLPLVVAEILIEMHGINGRLNKVKSCLENVENILLQTVSNIQQLSKVVNRTAEVLLQQQQVFSLRTEQLQQQIDQQQQENDRRFDQLQEVNRQQGDRLERAIISLENRFERLKNN